VTTASRATSTVTAGLVASAPAADRRVRSGSEVRLDDLHRRYGPTRALDGLSLTMHAGEMVALLGPSGCGKTTALRVLAGFESPDQGRVSIDGKDVTDVPAQRRGLGMVFQSYSLFPNLTARDNVAFGLRVRRRDAATRRSRADELLELVELGRQADQYPHQLSGGQQQRVALARALAIEPAVLLLDEPLSALDAKVRLQLREQIRSLQLRLGTTALFVTHDQEEALSMADRVGVMQAGRLEQIATPDELYARPSTAFVAEFVGTMNRLPGTMTERGVRVLDQVLPVQDRGGRADGQEVDVLVRPESLRLTPAAGGQAIVSTKTFLGSTTRVRVLVTPEVLVAVDLSSADASALSSGSAVDLTIDVAPVLVADRR